MTKQRSYGRVLAALWKFGLAEAIAYRASMAVWILTTTAPLIFLALWAGLSRSNPIGNYDQADFVSYFVAAFLVRQLTASWVIWDLERQIQTGELSTLLLRPVHPVVHHLMLNLAALPVRILLALPLAILVLLTIQAADLSSSLQYWAMVPLVLIGGWIINFSIQLMIGSIAFWLTSSSSLFELWIGAYMVLSGYIVPTSLFPSGLAQLSHYLPFYSTLGFPVELIIGRITSEQLWQYLVVQWTWVILLVGIAAYSLRRGLRVYGAVGA